MAAAAGLERDALLERARELAAKFGEEAAARDRERRFPHAEMTEFKQSGVQAIQVPREHGGPGGSNADGCRVIEILSQTDPNIGQMFHVHSHAVAMVNKVCKPALRDDFNRRLLAGELWITNAYSELAGKNVLDFQVKIEADGSDWRVNGKKFYCTGSLAGDEFYVNGVIPGTETVLLAFVSTSAPGVTIHDDWDAMGQRTTASGTIEFENVHVPAGRIAEADVLLSMGADDATLPGVVPQNAFTSVMVGVAKNALRDAVGYVTTRSRPWFQADVERAADDPYVQWRIGKMQAQVDAADAVLERSLEALEYADESPSPEARGDAAITVAKSRVVALEAALEVSQQLFQVCGSASTLSVYNFDRHWRNARTLSLHDPIDYKARAAGNNVLNDVYPDVSIYT